MTRRTTADSSTLAPAWLDGDRLRRFLDHVAVGLAVLDVHGRYVHGNPALAAIVGYSPEELEGMSFVDLTHPDDVDVGMDLFRELAEGVRESYQVEKRYLHRSGATVWGRLTVSLLSDDDGQPECVIAVVEDVTARHRAEHDLEVERAHLDHLFEKSPEAMVLVDANEVIVRTNPAFSGLFGFIEAEATGRSLSSVLLQADADTGSSGRTEAGAAFGPREIRLLCKDGSITDVSEVIVPVRAGGTQVASYRIYHDITDSKRAEAALRESEERFRTVVEVLGEGILIMDLDDQIVYANRRTLELTGFDEHEMIGRTSFELLIPPDEGARFEERMERRTRGEAQRYEMRQLCKGGRLIWVEINETPLHDAAGAIVGTVAVISDVTERRSAAEDLEAQAVTDDLTGLANRRGFFSQAEVDWVVATAKGEEVTLIFADMDGFKDINDRFGHAEGDRALQDVAELLRSVFRPSDLVEQVSAGSTVARLGGDEFVVLLTGTSSADPDTFRHRIDSALERFNRTEGRPYDLAMSIGIKRVECSSGVSFEEALRAADDEMYRRKRLRRGEAEHPDPEEE
jgi:diguanylate cyclase